MCVKMLTDECGATLVANKKNMVCRPSLYDDDDDNGNLERRLTRCERSFKRHGKQTNVGAVEPQREKLKTKL